MGLMRELKMWIVVRTDITIPMGKAMAQAGHAIAGSLVEAMVIDDPSHPHHKGLRVQTYFEQNQPKITVRVKTLAGLKRAFTETHALGLPCTFIIDEGRTVFPSPTPTVVGIGPCYRDELPKYVQDLQLL